MSERQAVVKTATSRSRNLASSSRAEYGESSNRSAKARQQASRGSRASGEFRMAVVVGGAELKVGGALAAEG